MHDFAHCCSLCYICLCRKRVSEVVPVCQKLWMSEIERLGLQQQLFWPLSSLSGTLCERLITSTGSDLVVVVAWCFSSSLPHTIKTATDLYIYFLLFGHTFAPLSKQHPSRLKATRNWTDFSRGIEVGKEAVWLTRKSKHAKAFDFSWLTDSLPRAAADRVEGSQGSLVLSRPLLLI